MCKVTRYTYLLRSDEVVRKKLGDQPWTKPFAASANILLGMRSAPARATGVEISLLSGKFDDEFTRLDETVPSDSMVRTSRAADLLNWRYRQRSDCEISSIEVLVARSDGELRAFLILICYCNGRALVADLFGRDIQDVGLDLLTETIAICRQKQLICIDAYCSESNRLKELFRGAGFRDRESAVHIVAYSRSDAYRRTSWSAGQAEIYS